MLNGSGTSEGPATRTTQAPSTNPLTLLTPVQSARFAAFRTRNEGTPGDSFVRPF